MEAAFGGRQTKGIDKMNEGVEGCQVTRSEKMESKAVRQGEREDGGRRRNVSDKGGQDKVGWLRGVTATKIRRSQRLDMCSPI